MPGEADGSAALGEYVATVRRRRGTVALTVFVVVTTALLVSFLRHPVYEAKATVAIVPATGSSFAAVTAAASSPTVAADAVKALGFTATIDVEPTSSSDAFAFVAHRRTALTSAKVANAFAAAFVADVGKLAPGSTAAVAKPAKDPRDPIEPNPVRNAIVAVIVGLFAGVALALTFEYAARGVTERTDVEHALSGTRVLGVVPLDNGYRAVDMQDIASLTVPNSAVAAAYRRIAGALEPLVMRKPGRTVLFTSPRPDTGAGTVAANIAGTMAREGHWVALVDCDPATNEVSELVDVPEGTPGLTAVLRGTVPLSAALFAAQGVPQLSIVTAGTRGEDEPPTLPVDRLAEVVRAVRAQVDVVVLVGVPVLVSPGGRAIAATCESVVLVGAAGWTKARDFRRAGQALRDADASLEAAVLVDVAPAVAVADAADRVSGREQHVP